MAFLNLSNPLTRPSSKAGITFTTTAPHAAHNPLPSVLTSSNHTLSYNVNAPLLSLCPNQERDKVVVAGREVLKILAIHHDGIEELTNLRSINTASKSGAHQTTNASSDVRWGLNYTKNLIATSNTNGNICIYDLGKGQPRLDRTLHEHHRQVHKIAFNPADGRILISGSQDGTMKVWDLRAKRSRSTIHGKSDAIRDIKFNEINTMEFAAAFDNGTVQRWHLHKDNMYERKLNAHNGPAFTVDWHPDGKHLASGGRDKTVKVWDVYSDPHRKPKYTITTLASIGQIAWRPHGAQATEIATCAINHDFRVHVWDLKRPFVASCVLDEHENAATGLFWRNENTLWSCSKDGKFLQHDIVYAPQPINTLSHSAFAWNIYEDFTFATQPRARAKRSGNVRFEIDDDIVDDRRRQGRASSFKASKPLIQNSVLDQPLEKFVPTQVTSTVHLPVFDTAPFQELAQRYVTSLRDGMTLSEACEINAEAAWDCGKYRTAQTWRALKLVFQFEDEEAAREAEARKKEEQARIESGIVARRAVLGIKGSEIGSSALHGVAGVHHHHSAGTTPVALRPVPDTPRSLLTPTVNPAALKPFGMDDALALPPAAFGTSLSSSVASTDGGETRPASRGHSDVDMGDPSPTKLSHSVLPIPSHSRLTDLHGIGGAGEHHHPSSLANISSSMSGQRASVPQVLDSFDSDAGFLPSLDNSGNDRPYSASPMNVPSTNNVNVDSAQASSSSLERPYQRQRQFSLGLISDRTSSSYDERSSLAGFDDQQQQNQQQQQQQQQNQQNQQEQQSRTSLGQTPAINNAASLQPISEEPFGRPSGYESMTASKVLSETDEHGHPRYTTDGRTPGRHYEKPWNAQSITENIIEWYSEQGDIQMCATMTLLLGGRVWLEERQSDEWVEGYIDLLQRFKLYLTAAEVTKATACPHAREKGQTNTHVYTSCHHCHRPLFNQTSPGGFWYCDRCRKLMDGCVICRGRVKGNWVMCQTCSHGGHDECLREWFLDEEVTTCAAVGCGHECLPTKL